MCYDEHREEADGNGWQRPRRCQEVGRQFRVKANEGDEAQTDANGEDKGGPEHVEKGPASSLRDDGHKHEKD